MTFPPGRNRRIFVAADILWSALAGTDAGDAAPAHTCAPEGRVKTRFLNFRVAQPADLAAAVRDTAVTRAHDALGALAIVDGPGLGHVFDLRSQIVRIGRDDGQEVQLDFGDTAVSRLCHASIAHYGGAAPFTIRDGLKPNPVLVNGVRLSGESRLSDGDLILIGETTLRFCCD